MTALTWETELSKSRFFSVKDGTIVLADLSASGSSQSDKLPTGIIDQKYKLLGLLGEGGMGAVFRARHLLLNKDVALKTFKSANLTEEERLRFQREAQAIAKLSHRNVVQVFDFGLSEDGVPYYTMEYLLGESLADSIKSNGPLTAAEAIQLFIPVCQGLSLAHSKGIIHRDLKPANLFIEKTTSAKGRHEIIKIVDFGIASLTNQSFDGQRLTTHGTIFGSPLYMSPEQSMGESITERADIYSFGCAFFETLTARPPFRGNNALDTIMLHHRAKPPTLKESSGGKDFPAALERAVATMLAKSPGDRQSSMDQVAADLSQIFSGQKIVNTIAAHTADKSLLEPDFRAPTRQAKTPKVQLSKPPGWLLKLAVPFLLMGVAVTLYLSSRRFTPWPVSKKPIDTQSMTDEAIHTGSTGSTQEPSGQNFQPTRKIVPLRGGKKGLQFTFPPDLYIGTIRDEKFPDNRTNLMGNYTWPRDRSVIFAPSTLFLQNPKFFDAFDPDDLYGLDLADGQPMQKNSKLMQHIGRLTGLRTLDLENSFIKESDLSEITRLRKLQFLSLNKTAIRGSSLAKLSQLRQLNWIRFSDCRDASGLVTALKGSVKLKLLQLNFDLLTSADFKTLGTLSELCTLRVNHSGMHESDLNYLTRLKKLKELDADDCKITTTVIQALTTMRNNSLRHVTFSRDGLSDHDAQTISNLGLKVTWLDHNKATAGTQATTRSQEASNQIFLPSCKTNKGVDGKMYKVFNFPRDLVLGTFIDPSFPGDHIDPVGEVTWRADRFPRFAPSEAFLQNPSNLDVFQPDHLWGLDLRHGQADQKDSNLMHHIGRLTGLRFLDLEDSEIGDADLAEVKKLPFLDSLSVNRTNISGSALARLPRLRQLNWISFRKCREVSALLAALKDCDKIQDLYLDQNHLTAADYKTIGTLANLQVLQINNCGMTSADLISLTSLPKLRTLQADDYSFTPESIEALKTMKKNGLERVVFSGPGLSQHYKNMIRKLFPKADFKENGDTNPGSVLKDFTGWAKSVP